MPKMTLNKLAQEMHDGFSKLEKSIDNKIDSKIGELTVLVKKGFDNTATKTDLELVSNRMSNFEIGQEDILLKLDNYAYKFEVNELKKRATKTEGRLNSLESKKK